jgi:hypothetical protein
MLANHGFGGVPEGIMRNIIKHELEIDGFAEEAEEGRSDVKAPSCHLLLYPVSSPVFL